MRKKSRTFKIVSFFLAILVMAILIIRNNNTEDSIVEAKDSYTVTLVDGNPSAGTLVLATYDKASGTYIDATSNKISVTPSTKIKAYYKSLNEGYNVFMWTIANESTLSIVMDNDDPSLYRTATTYIKTINNDLTIYAFAKSEAENVVYFYNSSVSSRRSLIGVSIVKDNNPATYTTVIKPTQKGFDFKNWSKDLSNVSEDMEVYPVYKSNIWTVFRDYYGLFLKGLGVTLLLSVVSVFLALFLGILLCLMRLSSYKIINFIAGAYVEVIRGVPLLLQLLVIYVILGPTKISLGGFFTTEVISCILALFINSGAYTCEIFRAGIQAVDKGQMEAGRALGMSKLNVMFKIVIPQGIKNCLPSIVNELIAMIKETSLAVSIDVSIGELMCVRKSITAATYINLPPYIIVAMIYFIVTFSLSKVVGLIERRLASHER